MTTKVVTRFAPSPTGFLHIGGARTALFNWLYAKANGGTFLLRIEDTDRARSSKEAVEAILDGLEWLGLDWDGEPIYQHTRAERHREVAGELLDKGLAYRCYCSPEELAAMRERARAEGRPPIYDGTWRDRGVGEAPEGVAPAIRLKAARDGETIIDDEVQGRVVFQNNVLDDLILLRSDGSPTYMLSVVVDDHDMGITHVVRGDDHLTNAARQSQLFEAMGWQRPIFAHVPLIHGPDGAKLSKRHGSLGVESYRAMGYLPAALRNYLVRLGWSHGDDEIFTTEQIIAWFDFAGIGRSPARFDFKKLENLNGHYIRENSDQSLIAQIKRGLGEFESDAGLPQSLTDGQWLQLEAAMPGLKERARTLVELMESAGYLWAKRPLTLDGKAAKLLDEAGRNVLAGVLPRLEAVNPWVSDELEAAVRGFAEDEALKLGKVAQPLRAALTGTTTSPGIFDVLEVLGREESLARVADQVARETA